MTLHKKPYIENKREASVKKLALRLEALKAQGLDERTIQRDATVRQIKAAIRQAKHQMARLAEIEALDRKKAEIREEKRNKPKEARPKVKKSPAGRIPPQSKKGKEAVHAGKRRRRITITRGSAAVESRLPGLIHPA